MVLANNEHPNEIVAANKQPGYPAFEIQPSFDGINIMTKNYWDSVYSQKKEQELSWFQSTPVHSLALIAELKLVRDALILDVGGGDSTLVDHLLKLNYRNITVLDISSKALDKTRARLESNSTGIEFINSDIINFESEKKFVLWHDRATFHFLRKPSDISAYVDIASRMIVPGGYLIISTFAPKGPESCSGLPISKYSETDLKALFARKFDNLRCFADTHLTPWGASQCFVYCAFRAKDHGSID